MIKVCTRNDPLLASIPLPYRHAVERAVQNLCSTGDTAMNTDDESFVLFIEPADEPQIVSAAIYKDIRQSLEGTFRDGNCLIGVVLYGNSGSGVSIVCPDRKGYAPQIAASLRNHL